MYEHEKIWETIVLVRAFLICRIEFRVGREGLKSQCPV